MKPLTILAALLAAAVTAAVGLAAPAAAAPEGVAVVDMVQLITKHPRASELQRKLETRQQEAEAYADSENKSLRALAAEIDLIGRNNPMRRAKEKEFLTRSQMLKLEIEWRKDEALREYMLGLERLYTTIQGLVSDYARNHGIQLVLLSSKPELQAADFNDYAAKVRLRGVVFSEPTLDITDQIRAMFMPRAPQPGGAGQPPR
jgi:Skp family chaperone for outer membrane proteins